MKRFLVMALVAMMLTPAMGWARFKVGYVDMQRVLQESKRGKKLLEHLQKEKELKEEDLKLKQQELKKLKDDYDRTKNMLSPQKRAEKEAELMRKMQDFQNLVNQYQMELQQKQDEYTQQAIGEIKLIISDYAKKHGYDLILVKDAVLYMPSAYDLTDVIIKEYDKWYQKVKGSK